MLYRLDDWLIDRVAQPAADRLARWTTADALGRSLVIGGAVFWCCNAMAEFATGSFGVLSAVSAALVSAGSFNLLRVIPPQSGANSTAPVARLAMRGLRAFMLPAAFVSYSFIALAYSSGQGGADDLFWGAGMTALLGGYYLMACRNNPPARREAREPRAAFATARGS